MNQAPKTAFGESSRIDIRSAFVGFVAAALLAVLLMPDAKRVAQFVLLVLVVSIAAATLCGFTFWPKARVRIARLLRWRYRVVRRNAATVALVGLSLFVTQHISLRIRDSRPVSLQAVNAHAPVTPAPVMITSPSLPLRSSIPSQSGTLAAKRENGPVVQPRVVVHPAGQPTIVPVVQPGSRPKELPQVHELGPPPVHRIRTEVLPAPLPAGLFNPDSKTIADGFVQSRDWLLRLNDYRSAAGLQRVEEDPQWSQAAANHARYLTETYGERLKAGHPPTLAEMHHENSRNRWYSPKSALAAQTGDEAMLPFRFDPVIAIDG